MRDNPEGRELDSADDNRRLQEFSFRFILHTVGKRTKKRL